MTVNVDKEKEYLKEMYEKYTYQDIAGFLGCSISSVIRWINGDTNLSRMARRAVRLKMAEQEKKNGQGPGGNP